MRSVLEVCVDSTASALAAKRGGASRLELCADLIVGGTTPSLALVRQVKAETGLPVRALLRPRFGDFCYDSYERSYGLFRAAMLLLGFRGSSNGAQTFGNVSTSRGSSAASSPPALLIAVQTVTL